MQAAASKVFHGLEAAMGDDMNGLSISLRVTVQKALTGFLSATMKLILARESKSQKEPLMSQPVTVARLAKVYQNPQTKNVIKIQLRT